MKRAWTFILLLGVVSLLADITYEGARSITGPYLALLGAGATAVGFVAGLGEFIGYGLRLLSGAIADRTGRYWTITFVGYFINLMAVPALALAGNWPLAAALIMVERTGKAIRAPARDALLAGASARIGHGSAFGVHEALDQIGAVAGPLIVGAALSLSGNYRISLAVLLVPALLALSALVLSKKWLGKAGFGVHAAVSSPPGSKSYYVLYLVAVSFIAAGYADYPLIAYHFHYSGQVSEEWVPLLYAVAMGTDALAALLLGRFFDRYGVAVLVASTVIAAFFAPLVFTGSFYTALAGIACWGVGMAAQESVMRAAVARMFPDGKRGLGFGIFHTVFGFSWFLGSLTMGWLYTRDLNLLIAFSVGMQLLSVPLFFWLGRKARGESGLR